MPPPSPSQQNQTHHGYTASRAPPPPPSFASGRDLPGATSAPRTGGFSISSILGGDPPTSQPHQSPPVTTQSPGISSMQPPSPRRGHSSSFGSFGQWRRPQTPERNALPAGIRLQETLGPVVGTSHPFGPSNNSPEYPRAAAPYGQYPPPPQIPRPAQSSPEDPARQPTDRGPPRPSSQPIGYGLPPREGAHIPPPSAGYRPPNGAPAHEQRQMREEPRPPMSSAYDERNSSPSASRDRPITVQPLGHSAYSPPQDMLRSAFHHAQGEDDNRSLFALSQWT